MTFAFQPAIERSRIEMLATGQWIRDNQSLLLLGPPGVGKTRLDVAAVERGLSTTHFRIEELLQPPAPGRPHPAGAPQASEVQ